MSEWEKVAATEMKNDKVVCVTGASGYIASWIVKLLLLRGQAAASSWLHYPSLYDPKKTEHLLALDGAKERLHLFEANLLQDGSFDDAIDGCEGLFHTASPVTSDVKDPQAELLDPAVKGTLNVLHSCAKSPSIKRVILTSSMAAVVVNGQPLSPEVIVNESWWSSPEFARENELWYALSKTMSEDAAWKFTKEINFDMITINPAVVLGPLLQPTVNSSTGLIHKLMSGAPAYPNLTFGWVHVRDVANPHILAFEVPSANGRYCLVESVAHISEIVGLLHELYPDVNRPDKCLEERFKPTYKVSRKKTESLGLNYIPLKICLVHTVKNLKEKGFLSF
ncbi:hypothetical protein Droror1_Dr00023398 [Drosera rotundifolia]